MSTSRSCRGCGAALRWWRNPETGKAMPLDAEPVRLALRADGRDWGVDPDGGHGDGAIVRGVLVADEGALAADEDGVGVVLVHRSHFLTCPQADRFSRSRRVD